MPLACFLPKVASTIKIQILAPKPTQGTPRDHWQCACAKQNQILQNTKTAITSRLLVAVTWNLATSCSQQARTILQNFNSLPPVVQKLSPKRHIFTPFKTITLNYTVFSQLVHFKTITLKYTVQLGPFKTITLDYTATPTNLLSRPQLVPLLSSFLFKTQNLIISRPVI